MAKAAEVAAEQTYFDIAHEHRERRRTRLASQRDGANDAVTEEALSRYTSKSLRSMSGPDEAVAFGRVDRKHACGGDLPDRLYVGTHVIFDDDGEVLVVNWQAPAAASYYRATYRDPHGLSRKRTFTCAENTITGFDDIVFADLAARVAQLGLDPDGPDDTLLRELNAERTGQMREIARTIQAAQYDVVSASFDQLLVVQGGPGTGKTAVALHRVSWLLYNRDDLRGGDVLVVGPNPIFVSYVRSVLPSLGDSGIRQTDLDHLPGLNVRLGRTEATEVAALKGDTRMGRLLSVALEQRVRLPSKTLTFHTGDQLVRLQPDEVADVVAKLRYRPYDAGRRALREHFRTFKKLNYDKADAEADNAADRIWPNLSAQRFLSDLFGSMPRLRAAGAGILDEDEVRMLHRPVDGDTAWSSADVPLLDHATASIGETPDRRYAHVVVDEAQDLSPMQLAMIARRSRAGSMTVVGDIAQSTGPWARYNWSDVIAALGREGVPSETQELTVSYRVPRPAFNLAVRALGDEVAGVRMPRVVREGPQPTVAHTDCGSRAGAAVAAAAAYAADGLLVGLICPDPLRSDVLSAASAASVQFTEASGMQAGTAVLVSPVDAKGLEFTAVVVVEPALIQAGSRCGRRLLFIALTRTTRHLTVVHCEPFPAADDAAGRARAGEASALHSSRHPSATPDEDAPHLGETTWSGSTDREATPPKPVGAPREATDRSDPDDAPPGRDRRLSGRIGDAVRRAARRPPRRGR